MGRENTDRVVGHCLTANGYLGTVLSVIGFAEFRHLSSYRRRGHFLGQAGECWEETSYQRLG